MKIFSGSSNRPLVEKICAELNTPIGDVYLKAFPSGERFCQFQENIRGSDVFLVQPTSQPANDNLMELLVMCDAAKRASAERITAVIPYFGYARQDKKDKPRVPISAKLVMDLLKASGFNRILTMDLHSPQTVGFADFPVDQLTFRPALVNSIKDLGIEVVVAPDVGAIKRADEYASVLGTDMAICSKKRFGDTKVEIQNFIGDVKGKKVILIDDLTESVGTFVEAATMCKKQGAVEIYCAVSHGCFTDIGIERLTKSFNLGLIKKMLVSNSINIGFAHEKLEVVDMSSLFAKAILNIHTNKSVSELF